MRERLPTDPVRSALMKRVRQKGTAAELAVAAALRRVGIAYRKNVRSLPGSPDFANKKRRWAIFVMGCFWHHHKGCKRGTVPKRNLTFWKDKFLANRRRDAAKIRMLRHLGFEVTIIWECMTGVAQGRLEARLDERINRRHPSGSPVASSRDRRARAGLSGADPQI